RRPDRASDIAPQCCVGAREQFADSTRLNDVIVGAQTQQMNLFLLVGLDRKDDDRNARRCPYAFQYFGTVHIGQTKIEDDEVGLLVSQRIEADSGVSRLAYGKAFLLERGADKPPDVRLVVDDEHGPL